MMKLISHCRTLFITLLDESQIFCHRFLEKHTFTKASLFTRQLVDKSAREKMAAEFHALRSTEAEIEAFVTEKRR
jgi:hypothetical protein